MIYLLQNDPIVPSGYFGELLADWRIDHRTIRLYEGEPWPNPAKGDGIILLGGTMGFDDQEDHPHLRSAVENLYNTVSEHFPVLGICLGAQLLARSLGAAVHRNFLGERGTGFVFLSESVARDPLLTGLPSPLPVLQWHDDSVELPQNADRLGWSPTCPNQIFRHGSAYGVQFHPEATGHVLAEWVLHSNASRDILREFEAERQTYRRVGRLLLANFLNLCGERRLERIAG